MIEQEMHQNQNNSKNGKKQKWKPLALALIFVFFGIPLLLISLWFVMEEITNKKSSPFEESERVVLDEQFSKFKRKISGQRY